MEADRGDSCVPFPPEAGLPEPALPKEQICYHTLESGCGGYVNLTFVRQWDMQGTAGGVGKVGWKSCDRRGFEKETKENYHR